MATTETTLDKSSETKELSEQQVDSVAGDSTSNANVSADASQDAADILSILDNFGAQQPTTDQLPKDTPLTTEEQGKLANLLGDAKPKNESEANEQAQISEQLSAPELENKEIQNTKTAFETPLSDAENNVKQTESLQTESAVMAEGHGNKDKLTSVLDAIQNETSDQSTAPVPAEPQIEQPKEQTIQPEPIEQAQAVFDEQKQVKLNNLLAKAQSQLEAITIECDALSKELALTKSRVKKLEKKEDDKKGNKQHQTHINKEVTHLRSELDKMTKGHEKLVAQVQKHLKLLEEANENREALETELRQAHKTIGSLQQEAKPFQSKIADYDKIVADLQSQLLDETTKLRTQFVDQTGKMTTIHEKLQNEVVQRRKAEKMLREIESRLVQLTQSKSVTQIKSSSHSCPISSTRKKGAK